MSADNLAASPDRPEAAGSLRVGVARAALQAALQTPGVVGSDPGPSRLRVTADPPADPLVGVSATAQADGRYGVDLSLVADMVPLHELAEQVRKRVRKRTRGERLEKVLGSINIDFAYVVTKEELAAAAAEKELERASAAAKLAPSAGSAKQAREPNLAAPTPEGKGGAKAIAAEGEQPDRVSEAGLEKPSVAAPLPGREGAALAVRQAALATDQAALAAKQAALAAEQAALTAGPGTALPRHSTERATEEQEQ